MATTIAVSNQKGGVGKTTTANALATGLKLKGFRVLAVDLDPQGNLSFSLKAEQEDVPTIYDLLKKEVMIEETVQKTELADIIPSNILLSSVDMEFTNTGREFILKEALSKVSEDYDYIILDTPPALSLLTVNAFTAADCILVPMLADIFSLQGLTQLNDTITRVRKYCNPDLEVKGIFLTKFNQRTILSREIKDTAQMISERLDIPLLNTFVRNSVAISEAQSMQSDIFEYTPNNTAVQDYQTLLNELIEKGL